MELHLMKQWREQQQQRQEDDESDQQPSVKIPKLFLETTSTTASTGVVGSAALPLFVSDHHHHHHHHQDQDQQHHSTNKLIHLSPFLSDSTSKFPRMGSNGYFSVAQWQELELQALIYRYMLAGADVPPELLLPIKKSLLHSAPPYFLHYSQCQPAALLQSGYWGRAAMDPEPGRCRRTDGKKWRCSRDVVAGHKYCERHMHRGRNRSRKPVEIPTPSTAATTSSGVINGGAGAGTLKTTITVSGGSALAGVPTGRSSNFGIPGPAPSMDLLHFNRSSSASRIGNNGLFESHQSEVKNHNSNSNKSDGHILRPFFDDWPRTMQESSNAESNLSRMNSTTSLSISMPENPPSDVSLKLSTGANAEEPGPRGREREVLQPNWAMGWASNNVTSMGGPLAEALRSSASNSSPTSVLHQLQRNSVSETSYVST